MSSLTCVASQKFLPPHGDQAISQRRARLLSDFRARFGLNAVSLQQTVNGLGDVPGLGCYERQDFFKQAACSCQVLPLG